MKKSALRALLAGAAALTLMLTGCSQGASSTGEGSKGDGKTLATVDTMFGEVKIAEPADGKLKVVALGWSDAETALALGVKPVAVYDWLGFGEKNKGVGPWAVDKFGSDKPTVMPRVDEAVDYEAIQAMEPDVILNVRSANDEAQYKRLSEIAPTVFGPKGAPAYATNWEDHTRMIAEALGKADEGKKLVADTEKKLAEAKAEHPEFAGKTAVSGSKFGDAYGASLAGDFRWDLLGSLGFTQNPAVLELKSQGFYAPVSTEQVSALDADVSVIMPIGLTVEDVKNDKLLQSLNVMKDGRAVILDPKTDLPNAFSAASILSIPVAISEMVPLLAEAAAKVK